MNIILLTFVCMAAMLGTIYGKFINFELAGGIPELEIDSVTQKNGLLFNQTLSNLKPGDTLYFPNKTFHMLGGIKAKDLFNVTFLIDGTIKFTDDRDEWPTDESGHVLECIELTNIENVIFSSRGKGTIDGNGKKWWGAIDMLKHGVFILLSYLQFLLF